MAEREVDIKAAHMAIPLLRTLQTLKQKINLAETESGFKAIILHMPLS